MLFTERFRQISQMTCQPESAGKMADFETLTLCISQNSSQRCTYFLQGLSNRVLSLLGKKFDFQPLSIFKLILLPMPCCYGLDVT